MFHNLIVTPLYNALIYLIDIIPGHSAGLAIIILTILIRFCLFPLSRKALKTQIEMRLIEPEVQRIRETVKDRNEQGKQMLELYRKNEVNPFAGFFLVLIQLPILLGLYQVFRSGLPKVNLSMLYSFVPNPEVISMHFLGSDLMQKSVILALLAVVSQFVQINLSLPKVEKKKDASFQHDLAYSMNVQMRYIFPLIMFPIAFISPVIALYLATTNIFSTVQELYIKRTLKNPKAKA